VPDRASPKTVAANHQKVRLQEENREEDPGRIPRFIECELSHDLVGSTCPGDTVQLSGILKARSSLQDDKASLYLQACHVSKRQDVALSLSEAEMHSISQRKDLLPLFAQSFCPRIYGQSLVKCMLPSARL